MSVLNFAFTEVKNPQKMQAYIDAAAPLMKQYGAEVVARGRYIKSLLGEEKASHIAGVFRFPDMQTAERFYSSEEYASLIALRDQAGVMSFNFYQE